MTPARRLRAAAAAGALVLAAEGCGSGARGNGLNVLFVTIETTRADHFGAYGCPRPTTPRLDAFAKESALFERDSSVSPRTNPSLASLMTSRYPQDHGVRNLFLPLEPDARTLAEVLRGAGYATGAIQTHPRLIAASGFAQGFETYDDAFDLHPLADQACRSAEAWIGRTSPGGRPWFLWIHLMDPHWTYDPPPPWRTMFGPEDPRPHELYRALAARETTIGPVIFRNKMPADEIQAFVNLYDGELRFTDAAIGDLLDRLRDGGLAAKTVVVLTADHGESLGEHDYYFEHGDFGTEPEVHVPLLIRSPSGVRPGLRVPWTVRSIDVAPTILDLLGLPSEPDFHGESLLSLLSDRGSDRLCLGETDDALHEENTRREVKGIRGKWRWARLGRFKMMYIPMQSGPPSRPLYDLEIDPGETRDVAAEHPDVAQRLAAELDRWIASDHGVDREYHISPESRDLLRSLGYVN